MLNFDEMEEKKLEQEAFEITMAERSKEELDGQIITVTATEYARAAQHKALLIALRTAVQTDSYAVERVATTVVSVFEELEGEGC